MSVEWVSLGGVSMWSPRTEDGPWSSDMSGYFNPTSIHWRLGGDTAATQHVGKVVRGFRLVGAVSLSGVSQMVMEVLRGIAQSPLPLTVPSQLALEQPPAPPGRAGERFNFNWQVARAVLPFGYLTPEVPWWDIAGAQFGGVRTKQPIALQPYPSGYGKIMRASPGNVQVLVSDPPMAQAQATQQMTLGQTLPISVRLFYPGFENDPISDVAVTLSASAGTQVSNNPFGAYGASSTVVTDATGTAYFSIKAVSGDANGSVIFDLAGESVTNILHSTVGFIIRDTAQPIATTTEYIRKLFQPALPLRVPVAVYADPPPPAAGRCVTYPEIPEIPGIAATVEVADDFGWNTGAHSIAEFDGDFELRFDEMGNGAIGAVVGIMPAVRENPGDYTRVTHGFYFTKTAGGTKQVAIIESGKVMRGPFGYSPSAVFTIQRAGTAVIYLIDGAVEYSSRLPLAGLAMAGTSLYATSDAVPSSDPIGDCFWTDIAGASQQCGGGGSETQPYRVYGCSLNNGTGLAQYFADPENPNNEPYVRWGGSTGVIVSESGAEYLFSVYSDQYFPSNLTDYIVADVLIRRFPRVDNGGAESEFVASITGVVLPMVFQSSNGNVPHRFKGPITGLPAFDPSYVYIIDGPWTVYNEAGEVLTTAPYSSGAVFDPSIEDAAAELPLDLNVDPTDPELESFSLALSGVCIYTLMGEDGAQIQYAGGSWEGEAFFTCDSFEGVIQGQPVTYIQAVCS